MHLKLSTIEALAWATDQSSITVRFSSNDQIILTEDAQSASLSDQWAWLSQSFEKGAPVAVSMAENLVLPSTISLTVTTIEAEDTSELRVLGPPRPGLMILDQKAVYGPNLTMLLKSAEASGSSVALALRNGIMIEDAELIPEPQARVLLGLGEGVPSED